MTATAKPAANTIEGRCACPEGGRYVCQSGDLFGEWLHMDGWPCLSARAGHPVQAVTSQEVLHGTSRRSDCITSQEYARLASQAPEWESLR